MTICLRSTRSTCVYVYEWCVYVCACVVYVGTVAQQVQTHPTPCRWVRNQLLTMRLIGKGSQTDEISYRAPMVVVVCELRKKKCWKKHQKGTEKASEALGVGDVQNEAFNGCCVYGRPACLPVRVPHEICRQFTVFRFNCVAARDAQNDFIE